MKEKTFTKRMVFIINKRFYWFSENIDSLCSVFYFGVESLILFCRVVILKGSVCKSIRAILVLSTNIVSLGRRGTQTLIVQKKVAVAFPCYNWLFQNELCK